MALYCRSCGMSSFRISHFRFRASDLSHSLFLQMPVRCTNCEERTYTSLQHFLQLRRERLERHKQRHMSK
jgi:hypothetical protein